MQELLTPDPITANPTARPAPNHTMRSGSSNVSKEVKEAKFQLAANMGTSVEMIESFYGKKRMRDPKMATEVTKFRGR